jgi:site-specific DNA-cytosine methylase
MRELVFRAAFPFGGSGAGARGFLDAAVTLPGFGVTARFESVGGIDVDSRACADFEYLTDSPELCADVLTLTPQDVRRQFGKNAPDCVFMSPPCKGASGLLSDAKSRTAKYQDMNELALVWTKLMLAAWSEPPRLVLLENVPRLKTRAAKMLTAVRKLLRGAGYVLSDGFHDCGELGGLAQHRRRYLLVARLPRRCAPFLYQPPKRRVRGCGDVLSELPMPGSAQAVALGRMHELPRLSWLNWVRLALIPAGGDWRDLEGVLAEGEARRAVFKRHAVETWAEPVGTVGGSGSNGVANVADPRIACAPRAGAYGVQDWLRPSKTITGSMDVDSAAAAIADPRAPNFFLAAGSDTRARHDKHRVMDWQDPLGTVIGADRIASGALSGADVRVSTAYDAGYGVLRWEDAARTIATKIGAGCGAYAVADPRTDRPDHGGPWIGDPRARPPFTPVIIAKDGTWHRPLTTLELAALQGFPLRVRGEPLKLAGDSHSSWRERIGNAVPPPAARAIAERMLVTLTESALGAFTLSNAPVWVAPEPEPGHHGHS